MKNIFAVMVLCLMALTATAVDKEKTQTVNLSVTEKGFVPNKISVKPGTHVILKVIRKTDSTCATEIKISEKKIKKDLPLNKEIIVDVGTLEKGKIRFACAMDMISGFIIVE